MDDFDFSFQPSIDKRQIDGLCTMRFLKMLKTLYFSDCRVWVKPIWPLPWDWRQLIIAFPHTTLIITR